MLEPVFSFSVVSHGQMSLVVSLLEDIQVHCRGMALELILTLNVPESSVISPEKYTFPIKIIRNASPKGFGANHNQALEQSYGTYFCIVNPDIRFDSNPLPALLACFDQPKVGVVAPLVVAPDGTVEDSVRRVPTPATILQKIRGKSRGPDYLIQSETLMVDWVGGMFMLLPRTVFEALGGFDEGYFLYYEDVDLCVRLHLLGWQVAACPHSHVIHHAQRTSHRQLKYLRWHVSSMARFFCSAGFWELRRLGRL